MLFAASVGAPQPIRQVRPINEWRPVHGGASGRALLAFLPDAEREAVLAGPLEPVTEHTVTDPEALRRVLDEVRKRGYSVSRGERVLGGVGGAGSLTNAEVAAVASAAQSASSAASAPRRRSGPATAGCSA